MGSTCIDLLDDCGLSSERYTVNGMIFKTYSEAIQWLQNTTRGDKMKITTNNIARDILSFFDLKAKDQADLIDGLDESEIETIETGSYFYYKSEVYSLSDFLRTDINGWDGSSSWCWFAGTLVKFCDRNERVIVGSYFCE